MKSFAKFESNAEFNATYRLGKKWYCDGFVIFFQPAKEAKMAVVASKKVGNAVKRNRAKRVLRALFSKLELRLKSGKYILIAQDRLFELAFANLEKNLKWGLKKLECLN